MSGQDDPHTLPEMADTICTTSGLQYLVRVGGKKLKILWLYSAYNNFTNYWPYLILIINPLSRVCLRGQKVPPISYKEVGI